MKKCWRRVNSNEVEQLAVHTRHSQKRIFDAFRCAAGGNWKNFKLGIDFLTVVRYSIENKEKPMRKRSTQSREHYRELQAVGLQYGNI